MNNQRIIQQKTGWGDLSTFLGIAVLGIKIKIAFASETFIEWICVILATFQKIDEPKLQIGIKILEHKADGSKWPIAPFQC